MIPYLGDFAEDATVYVYFNTFSSDDPSASVTVTDLIAGDIKVYKDGSITQIVTDGATVTVNFDTAELGDGVHLLTIDTSAHADYATGSDYMVRVEGITVDAGTINAAIAVFSIENRFNASAAALTTIDTEVAALQTDLDTLTAGVTLANGAITDVSLAGNMEIVFETDFATNYNTTTNAWETNFTDTIGTLATADFAANFLTEALIADNAFANEHFADNCLTTTEGDWEQAGVAPTAAEINTQCDLALTDIHLDHLFAASVADEIVDDSAWADLVSTTGDWSTFSKTTDSLQSIRDEQTTAQTDLDTISDGIITGTAATGTLSTTVSTSSLSGYTDGQLIGRIITFLAGPADGEASDITDYADTNGTITYTAMTLAAENGNAFKIT